jgi:hypothetical protein
LIAEWGDENESSKQRTRVSASPRGFAEKHLQHATAAAEVTRDRNQKAESAEKEGRNKFWVHEIKHDGFRLMMRPTRAFDEMTLVGGTLAIGLRGSRSGCRIADDTGEVEAEGIARSDQVRFTDTFRTQLGHGLRSETCQKRE